RTNMAMKGHRPGGGIACKQHVTTPVKTGTGSRGTHPGGVAQLGQHVGDKATHAKATGYRGEPLHNNRSFQPSKFGNELALNCAGNKAKPGCDREVMPSGGQGTHGPVAGSRPTPGRGILDNS